VLIEPVSWATAKKRTERLVRKAASSLAAEADRAQSFRDFLSGNTALGYTEWQGGAGSDFAGQGKEGDSLQTGKGRRDRRDKIAAQKAGGGGFAEKFGKAEEEREKTVSGGRSFDERARVEKGRKYKQGRQ